jgi:GNAT superfamily N-acetyltransferase
MRLLEAAAIPRRILPPRVGRGQDDRMTVEIREPTEADAEAVGRMHHASWVEAYAPLLPATFWEGFLENRIAMWRRALAASRPGTVNRIAVAGDEVVGLAVSAPARDGEGDAYPAVRERELFAMYVLAAHQGTGVAQRLLEAVLPHGTPAQLWVFEHNPRARRFYERNGFRPDGARHVFGPELGDQPEIRLVR